ncbi:MAG: hypothetical protein AAF493_05575 [Pseudomonadota bacterium]
MSRKRERAELIEQERRRRGERTRRLAVEELRDRVQRGSLRLAEQITAIAESLSIPLPISVSPDSTVSWYLRDTLMPLVDTRLEAVGFDGSSLSPYVGFDSLIVPCRARIGGHWHEPVLIEMLPTGSYHNWHHYKDACAVELIAPTSMLIPNQVREVSSRLAFPDRGVQGDALVATIGGNRIYVQTRDHSRSHWFFNWEHVSGRALAEAPLEIVSSSVPSDACDFPANDVMAEAVVRVLAMDWRH